MENRNRLSVESINLRTDTMPKRKEPAAASASASASDPAPANAKKSKSTPKKAASKPKNAAKGKARVGKSEARAVEWSEEVLHFGKAYAWALYCSAYYWNFHDDGGCWYDTCQDQSHTEGNWLALYRPGKGMKEYEDGKYTVLFLRTRDAPPITETLWNQVQPIIEWVDRLYLQSYNDLRRVTRGKWSDPIVEGTVEEIAKVVSPLKFDGRNIRMSLIVRGWEKNKCNDSWVPRRLAKWLGEYTADEITYEDMMDAAGHYLPHVRLDNGIPEKYYWFTDDSVEAAA